MYLKQYCSTECKEILNSLYGIESATNELDALRTAVKLQGLFDRLEEQSNE